jgi:hypothetical protein
MPCALAIAATEAPGTKHAATNSALMSAEYVRLLRRAVYLGVSESLNERDIPILSRPQHLGLWQFIAMMMGLSTYFNLLERGYS